MWGCFQFRTVTTNAGRVFPTHVGVFLLFVYTALCHNCLPHACGGVSVSYSSLTNSEVSSPRMWGCFLRLPVRNRHQGVFPTHVGVFPWRRGATPAQGRLPHACGGVSIEVTLQGNGKVSSPRMWGCFQVRARQAQAFGSLPHACGGVSKIICDIRVYRMSSPRMWGCFQPLERSPETRRVFPTHVGVFPPSQLQP